MLWCHFHVISILVLVIKVMLMLMLLLLSILFCYCKCCQHVSVTYQSLCKCLCSFYSIGVIIILEFFCYVIILVYYLLCKYLCCDIFIYSVCYLLIPFAYCNLQEIENWDKLIIISIRIWYDLFFIFLFLTFYIFCIILACNVVLLSSFIFFKGA